MYSKQLLEYVDLYQKKAISNKRYNELLEDLETRFRFEFTEKFEADESIKTILEKYDKKKGYESLDFYISGSGDNVLVLCVYLNSKKKSIPPNREQWATMGLSERTNYEHYIGSIQRDDFPENVLDCINWQSYASHPNRVTEGKTHRRGLGNQHYFHLSVKEFGLSAEMFQMFAGFIDQLMDFKMGNPVDRLNKWIAQLEFEQKNVLKNIEELKKKDDELGTKLEKYKKDLAGYSTE